MPRFDVTPRARPFVENLPLAALAGLAAGLALLALAPSAGAAANDLIENAKPLSGWSHRSLEVVDGPAGFVSLQAGEPVDCAGGTSLPQVWPGFNVYFANAFWFKWTAPASGEVAIDTGSHASVGTTEMRAALAAYEVLPGGGRAATPVACGGQGAVATFWNFPGQGSLLDTDAIGIRFAATEGRTYFIEVGSSVEWHHDSYDWRALPFSTGKLVLNLALHAEPANDEVATATALGAALPLEASGAFDAATTSYYEPLACDGKAFDRTVWYAWRAPESKSVIATAGPSVFLGVYRSDGTVGCDRPGLWSGPYFRFDAVAGTEYFVQVGHDVESSLFPTSTFTLRLEYAPPANDHYAGVQIIDYSVSTTPDRAIVADNLGATFDEGDATVGGRAGSTVHYAWQAGDEGVATFDTIGGTDFDTTLAVFGYLDGGWVLVGENDDSPGDDGRATTQSRVSFAARAGAWYAIQVGGYEGRQGHFRLDVAFRPSNDAFAGAKTLPAAAPSSTLGHNVGATKAGEPSSCGMGSGVWYAWTPTQNGPARFTAVDSGSSFHVVIAAFSGSSLATLTSLACDDAPPGEGARVTFAATAGTTYRILVGGLAGCADCAYQGALGRFTLHASQPVEAPQTLVTVSGTPGENGWYRSRVLVTVSCVAPEATTCTPFARREGTSAWSTPITPLPFSSDGVARLYAYSATPLATSAIETIEIRVDQTAPFYTIARSPAANALGWNRGDVTVSWSCRDATSGVAAQPAPQRLTAEGGDQVAEAHCADRAGNVLRASVAVAIDRTLPTLASATLPASAASGWSAGDVTVTWTCEDAGSGVASAPAARTVSEEGRTDVAASCADRAGNVASASVGVAIDRTPPTLAATRTPANERGWNAGDVEIVWSCADALSGPLHAPARSTVVSAEGAGRSARAVCEDRAGNVATLLVEGVNVDKTPPSVTLSSRTAPTPFGWNNAPVEVAWSCEDALSGALEASVRDALAREGDAQVARAVCEDAAGNRAAAILEGIRIDLTPPTIEGARSPLANERGWSNARVVVSFPCADALSGVAWSAPDFAIDEETAGSTVRGECVDAAGNAASALVPDVRVDLTPPALHATPLEEPNGNGWHAAPARVLFECGDALSGPATADRIVTVGQEGANVTAAAECEDLAGNRGFGALAGLRLDFTPPTIAIALDGPGGENGWWRGDVLATASCEDALSGADAPSLAVDGSASPAASATVAGDGRHALSATCRDLAGNAASATRAVPIDATAPSGAILVPRVAVGPYELAWNGTDATSGIVRVAVLEHVPGGPIAQPCDERFAPASELAGACARDAFLGAKCYRLYVEDEAGNVLVTDTIGSTPGVEASQLERCVVGAAPQPPQATLAAPARRGA